MTHQDSVPCARSRRDLSGGSSRELRGCLRITEAFSQDRFPETLGPGSLARHAMHHGLAEEQLCITGIERQALGADRQRTEAITPHLVAAGDQGEEPK